MEPCNAVYGEAGADRKVRHLYLSVINNRHLPDLLLISGILRADLFDEAAVDLLDDLINSRKEP